jgi:hypothetical protein
LGTQNTKYLAISLILVILLGLACSSTTLFSKPTPQPPTPSAWSLPEIRHYENDILAFDYPDGVRIFEAGDPAFDLFPGDIRLGGELVVGLADPTWIKSGYLYSSIGVFRYQVPPDSNLEKIMETTYQTIWQGEDIPGENGPVVFAGMEAVQKSYRVASGPLWYNLRDIWQEVEGGVLRFSFWEEVYTPDFQTVARLFIENLSIQDSLPPLEIIPTPTPPPTPTPLPDSERMHYENNAVAFDYPAKMALIESEDPTFQCYPDFQLGGELLVGLVDPKFTTSDHYYRSIRIFHQQMPTGSNLEAIMQTAYQQAETKFPRNPGVVDATGPVTVAGLSGFQWTYRIYSGEPAYEMRDIWLPKDGELFLVSVWTEYTNPDDFASFQSSAEVLINSLQIKE